VTRLPHLIALCLAAGLGACTADVREPASGEEATLIELTIPVEGFVDEAVWRHAPDGCEGRLLHESEIHRIARAENAPSLAVVIDDEGEVLCVDTIESIAIELERVSGDPSPDPMMPKMLR
jgi:hypothetical protein